MSNFAYKLSFNGCSKIVLPLLVVCMVCLPFSLVGAQTVTSTQTVNIQSFDAGRSLIYQDSSNNRYVTWTVASGSFNGSATIDITSTQGTFTITPTSSCTVLMTTVNAYIYEGGIYQTTYSFSYVAGVQKTATWVFTLPPATPTPTPITPVPQYYLLLNATSGGTTTPAPNIYHFYNIGESVTITAVPSDGWAFDYWLFYDGSNSTSASTALTMNSNKTALAVFVYIPVVGQPTPAPTIQPTPIPTNPVFINSIDSTSLMQYLNNHDFSGFIIACWTMNLGQSFFIILAVIATIAIYIKYQNLIAIGIMWIVLGAVFIVWVPIVAPFIIFAFVLGFGSILYKVLGESKP